MHGPRATDLQDLQARDQERAGDLGGDSMSRPDRRVRGRHAKGKN